MTSKDLFPISCHLFWAFNFVYFNDVTDCLFIFSDVNHPDPWRLECSVEVSPLSQSFRVEETEVVSPDGQIYKYPVLWLITVEMMLSFFISYLLKSLLLFPGLSSRSCLTGKRSYLGSWSIKKLALSEYNKKQAFLLGVASSQTFL